MKYPEAIEVIKDNWPDATFPKLREALTMAINLMNSEICTLNLKNSGACGAKNCEGEKCKYFKPIG